MDNDKIIKKLLDHDDEFTKIREEMREYNDRAMTRFDEMMVILQRLDQERVFTLERVKRLESDVEKHTKDLKEIKRILKIA